jgi:hypothetical protein
MAASLREWRQQINPIRQGWGFEAGEGGRTLDIHVGNESSPHVQGMYDKRVTSSSDSAHSAGAADHRVAVTDTELHAVVTSWVTLPPFVKAGILAMIRAAAD